MIEEKFDKEIKINREKVKEMCKGTSLDRLYNLVRLASASVPTDPWSPWS